jgi:mannose-6-phosphate isomerase-like protein (cupin superfamily)
VTGCGWHGEGIEMDFKFKRVVARVDENGKSVVAEESMLQPRTAKMMPGVEFYKVWGSDEVPSAPVTELAPVHDPFFPAAGGSRWLIAVFPPDSSAMEADISAEELEADAERALPGLMGVFEPDNPGFHSTVSIDYNIVIEGELYLEFDDGVEVAPPAGTCVVQNGNRHCWHNRGDVPAKMVSILLGARPAQ